MNSEYENVGNIPISLNVHQIDNFNKQLDAIYNCPISLNSFSSHSITPCGLTYRSQWICESLESKKPARWIDDL